MKIVLASFLAVFAVCAALAQEPVDAKSCPLRQGSCCAPADGSDDWDFVSVAFFPKAPPSADVVDTYGLKLGIPVSYGDSAKVVGAELGIFASTTKNVKGLQAALLYCKAEKVSGVQANPIANVAKTVSGVQAGLVNVSEGESFQFGLINYIENSSVPFFPLVNFKL